MQPFIRKYKGYILGIGIGAIAGYLYWRFVGCSSGSCPITSKWYYTVLFGMLLGFIIGSPDRTKKTDKGDTIVNN